MAEIPELDLSSGLESELNMETQKTSVAENNVDAFQSKFEKSDSFVIDMDAFSPGSINKDSNTNSRITMQRSISRKGWGDKKVNVPTALHSWDTVPTACSPSPKPSPKDVVVGCGTPEKAAAMVTVGSTDHCSSPQLHHQITITAGNNFTTAAINETKGIARRNSFKRPLTNWGYDPKRILLLFATLSSIGSILLIYLTFTISSNNQNADESWFDWKQRQNL